MENKAVHIYLKWHIPTVEPAWTPGYSRRAADGVENEANGKSAYGLMGLYNCRPAPVTSDGDMSGGGGPPFIRCEFIPAVSWGAPGRRGARKRGAPAGVCVLRACCWSISPVVGSNARPAAACSRKEWGKTQPKWPGWLVSHEYKWGVRHVVGFQ